MNKIIESLTLAGMAAMIAVKWDAEQIGIAFCAFAIVTAVSKVLGE